MGFLNFSDDSGKKNIARVLFEYGGNREGYWTSEKFLQQMDHAVTIAESKYPGAQLIWVFDNSSCHNAYADDALIAAHMNAKPGGKQHCIRDTVWQGRVQKMNTQDETPKRLIQVLKERESYRRKMKLEEMQHEISTHPDSKDKKTKLQRFLKQRGHTCIMLPKFHCEFNPIEQFWGHAKRYTRVHTNYTLPKLRSIISEAMDSISPETIQNYFRKAKN